MSEEFALDELDRSIIDLLRADGRLSNQDIGKKLGLTAATVSIRIRRMEAANKLRVVAVSDFSANDLMILMPVAIKVFGKSVTEVSRRLAEFPEVFAMHIVSGTYDIDALLAFGRYHELEEFVREKLSTIKGIRSIEMAVAVDVLKYKFDVTPIGELRPVS